MLETSDSRDHRGWGSVLRLLLLTREFPPYIGGIGTYVHEISRAAQALGHAVEVIAPAAEGQPATPPARDDAGRTVSRFRPGGSPLRDILPIRHALRARRAAASFDVVHACDRASLVAAILPPFAPGARLCTTVYGSEVVRWERSRLYRLLDPRLFSRPARVTGISAYTQDALERLLALAPMTAPRPARQHIPLALADWWQDPPAVPPGWTPPEGAFVIGTVGRLDARKGHEGVIEACTLLPPDHRARVVYAVVGPGPAAYIETLRVQAAQAGIRLAYLGAPPTDALPGCYRAMHVHILNARPVAHTIEGFGLVILEAGSCGTPTIAASVGGIPEVIEADRTGLLVPAGDAAALAGAIRGLMDEPGRRLALGAAARTHALARRWSDVARETYEFFGAN